MELNSENYSQRKWFVKYWANYMKSVPNKEWSRQQNIVINSQLMSATKDRDLYMKIKNAMCIIIDE